MKKLTIDNMHELQPWIALAGYEDCNANVVTMLMWQVPYPFFFEVHEHFALACFRIEAEHEWYWYMPFCAEEHRMEAIQAMLAPAEIPPRIACLSREWRDWLQARFPAPCPHGGKAAAVIPHRWRRAVPPYRPVRR